ncbi:cytochrome P450 [Panaeolus papilionaceus]|nr:cytochrome P450 [Panaeolus papilionaceus]
MHTTTFDNTVRELSLYSVTSCFAIFIDHMSYLLSLTMLSALNLALFCIMTTYIGWKVLAYRRAVKNIHNLHGDLVPVEPHTVLRHIITMIPGVNSVLKLTLDTNFLHDWGHDIYLQGGWDARSVITILPNVETYLFLADAAAAKEITTYRSRFPKPMKFYDVLSFFGHNIVASEGEQWKKYRRISAPAFTEVSISLQNLSIETWQIKICKTKQNNVLVWEETTRIMNELFEGMWKDKQSVTVDHCLDITLPIILFVISCAGFGQSISWENDDDIPAGHKMSFKKAMYIVSEDFFIPLVVPKWALGLTKRTEAAGQALTELRAYFLEMIHRRHLSEKVERHDLLSILLEENSHHLDDAPLTDDEVIGNVFIFIIAGHETTSHTLAFALGLLALYPDEQEKLYQHIKSVIPDGQSPTYADTSLLTHSLAVFQETLRLFPPVSAIAKTPAEDTSLTIHNAKGESKRIPIPQGSYVNIHVTAIHYNPRYWPDPKSFKPERFLKPDWPRDAFLPFSGGARACLGRRFAEIEAIVILTMLASKYKITVKEEPQFANETFEQRKARVLACDTGLTVTRRFLARVNLGNSKFCFIPFCDVTHIFSIGLLLPMYLHWFDEPGQLIDDNDPVPRNSSVDKVVGNLETGAGKHLSFRETPSEPVAKLVVPLQVRLCASSAQPQYLYLQDDWDVRRIITMIPNVEIRILLADADAAKVRVFF